MSRSKLLLPSLALLAVSLTACGSTTLQAVPNSTVRVEKPVMEPGTELDLKIFTQASQCGNLTDAEPENCLPWIDRGSGEVHLAFQLLAGTDPWAMALDKEHVQVVHQGSLIQEGQNQQRYELIPHAPMKTDQLFVLLIDGSGSMNEGPAGDTKIERLRKALLLPEVGEAFFPKGQSTGLVLLEFSGSNVRPVGGAMKVITQRREFKQLVRDSLRAGGGYTNLYEAIRYGTGELLTDVPEVTDFLRTTTGAPTVIALTDGFNNERYDDTCATNAKRLERLVRHLKDLSSGDEGIQGRPNVFTVGLGRPFNRRFDLEKVENLESVRPGQLCGGKYKDMRIDGQLETLGIDNASLAWIAKVGGGDSFVKRRTDGLGEAFTAAAAEQYEWFELRYSLDPFYLRRSFETRVRLSAFAQAEASVQIHPSAWLDAPSGERGENGWTRPASFTRAAALTMPLLGLLVALSFVAPAWFNARRIIFGRLRPPAAPAAPGPEAGAPPAAGPGPTAAAPPSGQGALPGT